MSIESTRFDSIRTILCQLLGMTEVEIKEDTKLLSLAMDELDNVEFIMWLEDDFGIEILDEDWDNLHESDPSVNDVVRLVSRMLEEKTAKRS